VKGKYRVNINYDWCKRCGICYWVCPTKTIVRGELDVPKVEDHDRCVGCLMCENLCPDFAVDVVQVEAKAGEKQ